MQQLVGEREHVEGRLEMADRVVQVDRLDGIAADEVDDVERLAQPQQVAERGPVARPADTVEVDDVGRAADRSEREMVAADRERVLRVPRVHLERRRAGPDQVGHQLRVEADAVGASARPRRRRPRAGHATRDRGSPCRSRRGSAARRGGSPPTRRPTRPRSGGRSCAAGRTGVARAGASSCPRSGSGLAGDHVGCRCRSPSLTRTVSMRPTAFVRTGITGTNVPTLLVRSRL